MSPPLEPGPIYAPGAGPPHPALQRRLAERARREEAARAAAATWTAPAPVPPEPPAFAAPPPVAVDYPPPPAPTPARRAPATAVAEKRHFDWVIGVVLGIVLGLGVATAFVFIGSEDTVDAPQVRGDVPAKTDTPPAGTQDEPERVPSE